MKAEIDLEPDAADAWPAAMRTPSPVTPQATNQPPGLGSLSPPPRRRWGNFHGGPLDLVTCAAAMLTATGLWALGLAHVVSRESLWLWALVLVASVVVTVAGQLRWGSHPSASLAQTRIGTRVVATTLIMYMTGWGPILAVGYIFLVHDVIVEMGARYWRALAAWSAIGCLGGSAAIALRISPTLISRPSVYGLAGLVALVTVFAIAFLGTSGENIEAAQRSLRESEGKLRRTIETANEAYVEIEGPEAIITEWNSHAEMIFGWTRLEAIGQRFADLVFVPATKDKYNVILNRALREGGASAHSKQVQGIYRHRDGHEVPVEISSWPTENNGDGYRLNLFLQDITKRVAATQALRRSNDNFRVLFEEHPHPMWVYDLMTLRFLEVNGAATEQYGYTRDEFLAMTIADIRPLDDLPMLLSGGHALSPDLLQAGTWRHRTKMGEVRDVEVSSHVLDFNGRKGALVMAQDITERRHLEQQLRDHALHDPLTGLPNRALMHDRMDQLIAQAKRSAAPAIVMCLNLDNFKLVNDAYGHDVGDELLRALGNRLVGALRAVDTVGRLGGDEFVILMAPPVQEADPEAVARKMLDLVRTRPFHLGGHDLTVTASVGINPGMGQGGGELIRNADVALCVAKELGGNRYSVFAQEMQTAVHERLVLAMDLREAIRTEQFETFYQPVVSLKDMHIIGVEALVRWQHPERGLLYPGQFIPLAEEVGLIGDIGNIVLRQACEQGARWQSQYEHFSVAVNVSVFQLRSNDFVSYVADALKRSHFDPENLVLEITESVLINDPDTIVARLRALKETGVRLAIDDFGTGYSSLSYLRELPFDILKIDQSFVASIADSAETATMLRTMIRMGRQLSLEIIAEGVEEEEQLNVLQRMRCQNAQGYLFSRPVDAEATSAVLVAWLLHGRPAVVPATLGSSVA